MRRKRYQNKHEKKQTNSTKAYSQNLTALTTSAVNSSLSKFRRWTGYVARILSRASSSIAAHYYFLYKSTKILSLSHLQHLNLSSILAASLTSNSLSTSAIQTPASFFFVSRCFHRRPLPWRSRRHSQRRGVHRGQGKKGRERSDQVPNRISKRLVNSGQC